MNSSSGWMESIGWKEGKKEGIESKWSPYRTSVLVVQRKECWVFPVHGWVTDAVHVGGVELVNEYIAQGKDLC